jgi:hypothetical protein
MRKTWLALALALSGCDVLGPSTTFEADNRTGQDLEVFAAACDVAAMQLLFVVPADGRRALPVKPGCYVVEGWVVDELLAIQVRIQVDEGTRRIVEFRRAADVGDSPPM